MFLYEILKDGIISYYPRLSIKFFVIKKKKGAQISRAPHLYITMKIL